jgi:WD40 repeat protein
MLTNNVIDLLCLLKLLLTSFLFIWIDVRWNPEMIAITTYSSVQNHVVLSISILRCKFWYTWTHVLQVWTASTGFCFITFSEHTNAVTAVHFMANNHSLLSASLDGTIRAWDLFRYRNFKTFTTPSPRQFVSLTADQSGEIICAGTLDSFEVCVCKQHFSLDSFVGYAQLIVPWLPKYCSCRYMFGQWRLVVCWMYSVATKDQFMV